MREELRGVIQDWILRASEVGELKDVAARVMATRGFPLHPNAPNRAGSLAIESFKAAGGRLGPAAFLAGASVELLMSAAYLFDDLADRDGRIDSDISPEEELALAIALLSSGHAAACEAAQRMEFKPWSLELLMRFHRSCVEASTGQFLDAHYQHRDLATADDALKMTILKAGSFGKLAAGFGAGLATDRPDIVCLFEDFGSNLFTYFQLIDDLKDACSGESARSDLAQGKKTVPIAFFNSSAASCSPPGQGNRVQFPASGADAVDIERSFNSSGAGTFGTLVAEAFLNRAKANLAAIESHVGAAEHLKGLVHAAELQGLEVAVLA